MNTNKGELQQQQQQRSIEKKNMRNKVSSASPAVTSNENIKRALVLARNTIRTKFRQLHNQRLQFDHNVNEKYKSVTGPLQKLVKSKNAENKKEGGDDKKPSSSALPPPTSDKKEFIAWKKEQMEDQPKRMDLQDFDLPEQDMEWDLETPMSVLSPSNSGFHTAKAPRTRHSVERPAAARRSFNFASPFVSKKQSPMVAAAAPAPPPPSTRSISEGNLNITGIEPIANDDNIGDDDDDDEDGAGSLEYQAYQKTKRKRSNSASHSSPRKPSPPPPPPKSLTPPKSLEARGTQQALAKTIKKVKQTTPREDRQYGFRTNSRQQIFLGNDPVLVTSDDDRTNYAYLVRGKTYPISHGLTNLLLQSNPDPNSYNENDRQTYKRMLEVTSAHKIGFKHGAKIRRLDSSVKYKNIIEPLFPKQTPVIVARRIATRRATHAGNTNDTVAGKGIFRGGCLRKPQTTYKSVRRNNKCNFNYTYWDDPNELVDRLRILLASQSVGHTGHQNEMISIVEELREAKIIK